MNGEKTASFIRVEGILFKKALLSFSAYLAANSPGLTERVFKLGQALFLAPASRLIETGDRSLSNRLNALILKDLSQDRIEVLAEEYFESILKDRVLEDGFDLVRRVEKEGHQIILYSDELEITLLPFASRLKGIGRLFGNRLEFKDGIATGRLEEPIIGGFNGNRDLLQKAQNEGIDLARSSAYGICSADLPLLQSVGNPCAVNPDFVLRRTAREADWPVMEY